MKRMGDLVGKLVDKKAFSLQIQCVSLVVGGWSAWVVHCGAFSPHSFGFGMEYDREGVGGNF